MGVEIERKFLVDAALWRDLPGKPPGTVFRQAYLTSEPGITLRVRVTHAHAFLTIKGPVVDITRTEYEYEIPRQDGIELIEKFAVSELAKTRYEIPYAGKAWEVDEFQGDNAGLLIAELEMASADEHFTPPPWLGPEVTGDPRYYNSSLSQHPFKAWAGE